MLRITINNKNELQLEMSCKNTVIQNEVLKLSSGKVIKVTNYIKKLTEDDIEELIYTLNKYVKGGE